MTDLRRRRLRDEAKIGRVMRAARGWSDCSDYARNERGEGEASMVLGHYGLRFCAERLAPRASLGCLVFAAQFADLLWPVRRSCSWLTLNQ
jgi:hypothetical protein